MTRPVSKEERAFIALVAEKLSQNSLRLQLLSDIDVATAEDVTSDGSRVMFHLAGYHRPPYRGQHSFGVEGSIEDSDGTQISIDLFADQNDRLLELEFIRHDQGKILSPNWSSLKLF